MTAVIKMRERRGPAETSRSATIRSLGHQLPELGTLFREDPGFLEAQSVCYFAAVAMPKQTSVTPPARLTALPLPGDASQLRVASATAAYSR